MAWILQSAAEQSSWWAGVIPSKEKTLHLSIALVEYIGVVSRLQGHSKPIDGGLFSLSALRMVDPSYLSI